MSFIVTLILALFKFQIALYKNNIIVKFDQIILKLNDFEFSQSDPCSPYFSLGLQSLLYYKPVAKTVV